MTVEKQIIVSYYFGGILKHYRNGVQLSCRCLPTDNHWEIWWCHDSVLLEEDCWS